MIYIDHLVSCLTGSLAEVSSLEQISTEDTELSLHDLAKNVFPNKTGTLAYKLYFNGYPHKTYFMWVCCLSICMSDAEAPIESNLQNDPKGKVTRAVSICGPCTVRKEQPQPLCALLPPSMEACTVYEVSQSFTSISRSQENLKTTTVHTEPSDGDGKDTTMCC